jgi:hypothetical protein
MTSECAVTKGKRAGEHQHLICGFATPGRRFRKHFAVTRGQSRRLLRQRKLPPVCGCWNMPAIIDSSWPRVI